MILYINNLRQPLREPVAHNDTAKVIINIIIANFKAVF